MDPRTAGHVLTQISDLLELSGENRFKARAYRSAASAVLEVNTDDLCPIYRDGSLAKLKGIGPATLGVIGDLCETGESRYFEQLREQTPEGLLEMLRVPGLGIAKIHALHEGLGISSIQELETAARDGQLAKLKGFGPKTAEKLLKGIGYMRSTTAYILYPHALIEARRLLAMVEAHPEVERALIAGSIRRRRETVRDIDIVAACRTTPAAVAASFAHAGGVKEVIGAGGRSITIRYVDGTLLDLHCVEPERFGVALWRATGSESHTTELRARASEQGFTLGEDELRDASGTVLPIVDEVGALRCARPPLHRAGAARGARRARRRRTTRTAVAHRLRRHQGRPALPLAILRRQGDDRRDGGGGEGARVELHRHLRPLASRRSTPAASRARRSSRSTRRSTASTRRSTASRFSRASRRTFSPTAESTTTTRSSSGSISSSGRCTRGSGWIARR